MMEPKQRFSDRVDDYVRYRPSYPAALRDMLSRLCGLQESRTVADVGSGTGLFARLLLETGARVIGIEPNTAMRSAAEHAFGGHARFESKNGCAEATGLPDASVDLIAAAQAFHWFEPAQTRVEFARILRPGGHIVLVWNQRKDTRMNRDYEAMLERFAPDYKSVRGKDRDPRIRAFFAPSVPDVVRLDNEQRLGEAGQRGRLMSSSYAPRLGSPMHEPMMAELASIFRTHSTDGQVVIAYETVVWCGKLV